MKICILVASNNLRKIQSLVLVLRIKDIQLQLKLNRIAQDNNFYEQELLRNVEIDTAKGKLDPDSLNNSRNICNQN